MKRLETAFTRVLGIDTPIVQAPIGSASTPELVAAVSNAGGLGMLSITWRTLEETRADIRRIKELTSRPFGVNLVLEWNPVEHLGIAIEEGVPLISFFWGDARPYVDQIHRAGLLVCHTVGSAAEAVEDRDAGVDVVVAQGWEAGGHVWGEVSTMALTPAVVDAVHPLPVLAAGGIADGRGIAAALCLGATGAWMGTRFLLATEAPIHVRYRERLERARETGTRHTTIFDEGWPDSALRTLPNTTLELWEREGGAPGRAKPGEGEVVAHRADGEPIVRYVGEIPMEGVTGDIDAMVHYAGQSVGTINTSMPAREIVHNLTEETLRTLTRLSPREAENGGNGKT